MKKLLLSAAVIIAAISCQKEAVYQDCANLEPEFPVPDSLKVSVKAVVEDQTKTSLSGVTTSWKNNDQFKAFDANGNSATFQFNSSSGLFTIVTSSGSFNFETIAAAYYPAANVTSYNASTKAISASIAASQAYTAGTFANGASPLVSNQFDKTSNTLTFVNAFNTIKIPVKYTAGASLTYTAGEDSTALLASASTSPTITGVSLTAASTKLNGTFSFTLSGNNQVTVGKGNGTTTISLTGVPEKYTSTATNYYIVVPALGTSEKLTIQFVTGNDAIDQYFTLTANNSDKNALTKNKLLTMPDLSLIHEGAVGGKFSVSDTKQVRFAQGNLEYKASTGEWRFGNNQWTIIGSNNSNISDTYTGFIDLFGFGTSGKTYYPYTSSSTVSGNYATANINGTNNDWGVYNKIINGGNTANCWRTLTNDEIKYVFVTRSGNRFVNVNLNYSSTDDTKKVTGVIIFPDGYTVPSGITLNDINNHNKNPNYNPLSLANWKILEKGGCVFLPACGYRNVKTITTGLTAFIGNYWTSTYKGKNTSKTGLDYTAYYFYMLYHSTLNPPYNFTLGANDVNDCFGFAVRLARDVQ